MSPPERRYPAVRRKPRPSPRSTMPDTALTPGGRTAWVFSSLLFSMLISSAIAVMRIPLDKGECAQAETNGKSRRTARLDDGNLRKRLRIFVAPVMHRFGYREALGMPAGPLRWAP